jgi:hypothetical protein
MLTSPMPQSFKYQSVSSRTRPKPDQIPGTCAKNTNIAMQIQPWLAIVSPALAAGGGNNFTSPLGPNLRGDKWSDIENLGIVGRRDAGNPRIGQGRDKP